MAASVVVNGIAFNVYSYEEARKHFGYVYVTINNVNNDKYVGIAYRKASSKNYLGSGHYFKNALSKYGRENFTKYIIDVSNNKEDLEKLEVDYIRYRFGVNCATASDWYNIMDGLQRGGNSWAGMNAKSKEQRVSKMREKFKKIKFSRSRRQRMSVITSTRFKDKHERYKTSKATKEGMNNPIVHNKLIGKQHTTVYYPKIKGMTYQEVKYIYGVADRIKKGLDPLELSTPPEIAYLQHRAQKNRFLHSSSWNKGKSLSKELRQNLININSKIFKLNIPSISKVIYVRTSSIPKLAEYTRDNLDDFINKHIISDLINSGGTYNGKKEYYRGATIEVVNPDEGVTEDIIDYQMEVD